MASFEISYPSSVDAIQDTGRFANSNIILRSAGWSGKVIHTNSQDAADREFMFNIQGGLTNRFVIPNVDYGLTGHGGHVNYNAADMIIGISLEHFGQYGDNAQGQTRKQNQVYGRVYNSSGTPSPIPAWGGVVGSAALSADEAVIIIDTVNYDLNGTTSTQTDVSFRNCGFPSYDNPFDALLWPGYSAARANNTSAVIATDLPIFATDADLIEFIESNGTITRKMLNRSDPEEDYEEKFKFWYVKNVWGKNTQTATSYTQERNYRFFPQSQMKICFLRKNPTSGSPYDLELQIDYNYNVKKAGAYESDDGDYADYSGSVPTTYITESIAFGNDYYTVFKWDTNIPIAETQQDIDDYFAGIKTIDEIATNWDQIARNDEYLLDPEWTGTNRDSETPTGYNGMVYTYGAKLYEITNIELAALFNEVFDLANVQDILDGNKLFSESALDAVNSITYLPITSADEICTMGATADIYIGSWKSTNAQGRKVTKNDKRITVGSFTMTPIYNSFLDFEPYTRLYVMLPFAGFHELTISKYMGKTVKVEACIDITVGSILYLIYANNLLMDQFSGTCGAQRPLTARDSMQYISNIVNAVTGASNSIAGSAKGAGNIASGMTAASGAGMSAGAVAAGGAVAGAAVVGVGAVGGTLKAYDIKNAVDNPPQITTGSLAGVLSYFSNTKVHFIIAQKKVVTPSNLQTQIGRPSNQGGRVGMFSGYLKCSSFQLANNFTGSQAEMAEIYNVMAQGIYI